MISGYGQSEVLPQRGPPLTRLEHRDWVRLDVVDVRQRLVLPLSAKLS